MNNSIQAKLNKVASQIGHCKGIVYDIREGRYAVTVIGREYKGCNSITCKAETLKAATELAIRRASGLNLITRLTAQVAK